MVLPPVLGAAAPTVPLALTPMYAPSLYTHVAHKVNEPWKMAERCHNCQVIATENGTEFSDISQPSNGQRTGQADNNSNPLQVGKS